MTPKVRDDTLIYQRDEQKGETVLLTKFFIPPPTPALTPSTGLSNATLQQRLTAVRLFFDFLIEEGCERITRLAEENIRLETLFERIENVLRFHASKPSPGFQVTSNGEPFCTSSSRRPFGRAVWLPWPTMQDCAAKNSVGCKALILTPLIVWCACGLRLLQKRDETWLGSIRGTDRWYDLGLFHRRDGAQPAKAASQSVHPAPVRSVAGGSSLSSLIN
jgi:hypothetical protein